MARAKTKTTTKTKPSQDRIVADALTAGYKADPIWRALDAYKLAYGRVQMELGSSPNAEPSESSWNALTKAEAAVVNTAPTTVSGLIALARWFNVFVAMHDGIDSLNGHLAVEAYPKTMFRALQNLGSNSENDPVIHAIRHYRHKEAVFNRTPETDKKAHAKAEQEFSVALKMMRQTAPYTGPGVAEAIEAAVEDFGCEDEKFRDRLSLIAHAARGLI